MASLARTPSQLEDPASNAVQHTTSPLQTRANSASSETLPTAVQASPPNTTITDTPTTSSEDIATHDFYFIPIPTSLRYDPDKPPHFSLLLNIVFGLASTFCESLVGSLPYAVAEELMLITVVANLYYCQPLLSVYYKYHFRDLRLNSHQFSSPSRSMSRTTKYLVFRP